MSKSALTGLFAMLALLPCAAGAQSPPANPPVRAFALPPVEELRRVCASWLGQRTQRRTIRPVEPGWPIAGQSGSASLMSSATSSWNGFSFR